MVCILTCHDQIRTTKLTKSWWPKFVTICFKSRVNKLHIPYPPLNVILVVWISHLWNRLGQWLLFPLNPSFPHILHISRSTNCNPTGSSLYTLIHQFGCNHFITHSHVLTIILVFKLDFWPILIVYLPSPYLVFLSKQLLLCMLRMSHALSPNFWFQPVGEIHTRHKNQ